MAPKVTVPVSARALLQRINRKLRDKDQVMKVTKGAQALSSFGQYYLLDARRNRVVDTNCDLEAIGRKLEALADWEHLEGE